MRVKRDKRFEGFGADQRNVAGQYQ
jgi:hypothetical protein